MHYRPRSPRCRLQGVLCPWFDFWFRRYIISFACLYVSSIFFLNFFLTHLLPYLSFPLKIDPHRFQVGCRKRRLKLSLVFVFIFLCCGTFFDWRMHAFAVLGLVFFPYQARSPKWPILCRVGRKTTTQSIKINQESVSVQNLGYALCIGGWRPVQPMHRWWLGMHAVSALYRGRLADVATVDII